MKWIDAKISLPGHREEVIVSDGYASYAIAWYHSGDKSWSASNDMLDADNYDGGCHISLDGPIVWWAEIVSP